eukprot:CAMPEP_0182422418 /NCGR_PEP_ID=MMETSP1167-20130531/8097_1 /TAXON_ID=2988 /ORGANISM="Mallomonas Sp, Strain CCMP3275" /LENGTH=1133 /DNA_ID=CAMNT_0024600465 /DNA_START=65 /DNA_END=3466 /DNA_ORIENTATION=-
MSDIKVVKTKKFFVVNAGTTSSSGLDASEASSGSKKAVGKSKTGPECKEKSSAGKSDSSNKAISAPKSFARRDHLREIEKRIQQKWIDNEAFKTQRKSDKNGNPIPKYLVTFPYPYMNGRLHLGHAFSLTKAEFTVRFQRLLGKNTVFPFGFHCTGMPIQAAANKLKSEIKLYGCPPVFPVEEEKQSNETEEKSAESVVANKSKGKKSKLLVKGMTKTVRQWDILSKMVPEAEIPLFAEPEKWLSYFPPYGVSDLKSFGCCIDWRRSFITTSINEYYDAFIRWQFYRLKEGNRIRFGKRPNVYSILDGQVCADHDRASGEGVGPQEYTIIKLLVLPPYPPASPLNNPSLAGKKVYLAPATLRPETMYGQTNCFVLPEGSYGAYEMANGEVLVVSERAAKGLAHQDYTKEWGVSVLLQSLKGSDLLGLPLKAPNAVYERIYTLPLLSISMSKGTGVVTSVPSDSPDDYAALRELKEKPLFREKFGLTAEMVEPFDVVPIIEIEGYGTTSAVTMCERLDIKTHRDTEKLKKAKEEVYLKGFYEGVMIVGECKGMKVCDAKPVIRQSLLESGDALTYLEPESMVMSRSGEECIVALTDQWYLSYGDPEWVKTVSAHIHSDRFNNFHDKILERFDLSLSWLKEWACSRQFGLGTQLPWDKQWVIESLSDSTIYMAYYTIAHYFHGSSNAENLTGSSSASGIAPEQLTDEVFDFIFLHRDLVQPSTIPLATLQAMRDEFEYWYPMDLRVSATDLIPNHLTMSLYNHVEIWKDRPEMWPLGVYCNGHIMVDAEKMSKSKGNFLMLLECVEEFSTDGTRFALADAGDSMEDANFDRSVANNAILYLFTEEEWFRGVLTDYHADSLRTGELSFMDKTFSNEMDFQIEATKTAFEQMMYKEGLVRCWFDMMIARDIYRDWSTRCHIPMHRDVIMRFIESVIVMMSPITPHWCECLWEALGKDGLVLDATWPVYTSYNKLLRKQYLFFRDFMKNIRLAAMKVKNPADKKIAHVYLANSYEPKKVTMLRYLQTIINSDGSFSSDLMSQMKSYLEGQTDLKKDTKILMQFGAFMRDEAKERGPDALASEMAFDQKAILQENSVYITKALELTGVKFYNVEDSDVPGDKKKMDTAVPGKPAYHFFS